MRPVSASSIRGTVRRRPRKRAKPAHHTVDLCAGDLERRALRRLLTAADDAGHAPGRDPITVSAKPLHAWFTDSVRRVPNAPALVIAGQGLTYAELDAVSRDVADRVTGAGRRAGRVGLLASRSVASYAGYLGTLLAGGTVVPLNEAYPAERSATGGFPNSLVSTPSWSVLSSLNQ
ncbi:AMP-binding protein [Streptomyces sp. A1547]|uniref:AMP-binding protein n=1 Tax=Streptomyces sp. A1547 TaxID=2563105 RepID=UPI00109EC298|nr:AMP-binding protein [Streptomyces sp. A1547]THA29623.1 hypothetical protein E6W17_39105 [Streptomyces sp. A1547]